MDGKGTAAVTDARQITASLRRVHTTMSSSVMNADEAVSVLLQDGAILEDTLQDHKYGLKGSLQTTKHRLSRIKSAETREAYMIFLSLSFFTSVVMYIIAKRTRLLTIAWLAMHGAIRGKNAITSLTSKVGKVEFNASAEISVNLNESLMINLSQENPPLVSIAQVLNIPETMNTDHFEELIDLTAALNPVIDVVPRKGMVELSLEDLNIDILTSTAHESESGLKYVTFTEVSEVAVTTGDVIVEEASSSSFLASTSSSSSSSVAIEVSATGESIDVTEVSEAQSVPVESQEGDSEVQRKTLEVLLSGDISVEDAKADLEMSTTTVSESRSESESGLRDVTIPDLTSEVSEVEATDSDAIVEEASSSSLLASTSSSSPSSVAIEVSAAGDNIDVMHGEGQISSVTAENQDRDSEVEKKTQLDEPSRSEEGHHNHSGEHTQKNEESEQIKEEDVALEGLDELDSVEEVRYVGPTRSYWDGDNGEYADNYDHDSFEDEMDGEEINDDGNVHNSIQVHDGDNIRPIAVDDSNLQDDHIDVELDVENSSRDEL
jgi:Sec20